MWSRHLLKDVDCWTSSRWDGLFEYLDGALISIAQCVPMEKRPSTIL